MIDVKMVFVRFFEGGGGKKIEAAAPGPVVTCLADCIQKLSVGVKMMLILGAWKNDGIRSCTEQPALSDTIRIVVVFPFWSSPPR